MSTERENESPLAPLADAYEPTEADIERLLSKIQSSLGKPPPLPTAATSAGARTRKALFVGLSCAFVAVFAIGLYTVHEHDGSRDLASAPPAPAAASAPGVRPETTAASPTNLAVPSMAIDALPSAAEATTEGSTANNTGPAAANPAANAPAKTAKKTPHAPSPELGDTLEREARLLAEAVRANQSGESHRALALLEEHARTFPNGWLTSERDAERVVVLCNLGRRDAAVREAKAFLQGRPKSPLTRRVEMSCAGQL